MSLDEKKKMAMTGKKWEEIIPSEDVKQFIKELKKELWISYQKKGLNKIIDRLAGKGLI